MQLTRDEQRQAERRLLAAQAHVLAGSVDRAGDLLVQAIEVLHDPLSTAQAIGLKGRIQFHIGHVAEAAFALVEAAHRLRPLDPRAAAEALLSALEAIVFAGWASRISLLHEIAEITSLGINPRRAARADSDRSGPRSGEAMSGKGLSYGMVSELATYWHVLPGHEEDLRAATERFANVLDAVPREVNIHTGLRDSRHVIFDDGQRMMWATTFENEWDPYVDDFIQIGLEHFLDWMLHTVEGSDVQAWAEASGGVGQFNVRAMEDPDVKAQVKRSTGGLKAILQSVQSPGTGYFNNLSSWTMPQIEKAMQLQEAFDQVLDSPGAEEALQHPALKPLLEQAAA